MLDQADEPTRSEELAREQSLTELEQAIGDREQLSGDRDQVRIDYAQVAQDEQREQRVAADQGDDTIFDDRQAQLDRAQLNRDVNQESLDHAQEGRDKQQEALDSTRLVLSLPTSEQPAVADLSAVRRGAMERALAARVRAETALARAQAAILRAEASDFRAKNDKSAETLGAAKARV